VVIQRKALPFRLSNRDIYLPPGTQVRYDGCEDSPEYGVVVHCWQEETCQHYDCYVAFFGDSQPTETPAEKPYVLRYFSGSLTVIGSNQPIEFDGLDRALCVRTYFDIDAEEMHTLFIASIRDLASADYTAEQINAWADRAPSADVWRELAADGRKTWIAEAEGYRMAGFISLEADGHIDHLFVAPDFARRGIASRLLNHLEHHARLVKIPCLFTEASEVARPIFERQGFAVIERRDFELGGVAIHNYAMEKSLAG